MRAGDYPKLFKRTENWLTATPSCAALRESDGEFAGCGPSATGPSIRESRVLISLDILNYYLRIPTLYPKNLRVEAIEGFLL
jgi:hypothetical protein